MFRRRVDRYVSWSFLKAFVGTLVFVAALYISFDLLKSLNEFDAAQVPHVFAAIMVYYGCLLPVFLLDLVPGIVLVAAGTLLLRMASRRELLALRASGTSTARVLLPIFLLTFLISAGVFVVREAVVPRLARHQRVLEARLTGKESVRVLLEDPAHDRTVRVGRYCAGDGRMLSVSVIELHPAATPGGAGALKRIITAASATLRDGTLRLEDVQSCQAYSEETGKLLPAAVAPGQDLALATDLTSYAVVQAAGHEGTASPFAMTVPQLLTHMRRDPQVPDYAVTFHWKLASFFTPFVLLLIGIPCLIGRQVAAGSRFFGVVVSIAVAGGYYALVFILNSIGNGGELRPILAGWLPTILGGMVGFGLFETRMT